MATVYLCEHPQISGRQVAIKLYRTSERHSALLVARLKTEVENLGRLDHPGIVEVLDSDLIDGVPYIVMKYVEGVDLSRWAEIELSKDPVRRTRQAVDMMERIAGAIAAAHEAGVIHHDLKPQNVIVPTKGRLRMPVVVDFGTSRRLDAQEDADATFTHGTVPYMAPEEFDVSLERDPRLVDVWALGVMLYEHIAQCRPFEGATSAAVRYAILHRTPVNLAERVPGVAPAIAAVVMQALAKDPGGRPGSVRIFQQRLIAASASSRRGIRVRNVAAVLLLVGVIAVVAPRTWKHAQGKPEVTIVAVDGVRLEAGSVRLFRTLTPTLTLVIKDATHVPGSLLVFREKDGEHREVASALIPRAGTIRTATIELPSNATGPFSMSVRTPDGEEWVADQEPWRLDRAPPQLLAAVSFPDGRRKATGEITEDDLDVGILRIEVGDAGGSVGLRLIASGRVIDDIPSVGALSRPLHDLVGTTVVVEARDRAGNRSSTSFDVPLRRHPCRIEVPPSGRLTVSVDNLQTRVPVLGGGEAPEITVTPESARVGVSPRQGGQDILLQMPLDRLELPVDVTARAEDGTIVTSSLTLIRPLPPPGEAAAILKLVDGASMRDGRFMMSPGRHTFVFESRLAPRQFKFRVRCRLIDPRSGRLMAEGDVEPTEGISGKSFDMLKTEVDIPAREVYAGGVAVEFVLDDGTGRSSIRPVAGAFLTLTKPDPTNGSSSRPTR